MFKQLSMLRDDAGCVGTQFPDSADDVSGAEQFKIIGEIRMEFAADFRPGLRKARRQRPDDWFGLNLKIRVRCSCAAAFFRAPFDFINPFYKVSVLGAEQRRAGSDLQVQSLKLGYEAAIVIEHPQIDHEHSAGGIAGRSGLHISPKIAFRPAPERKSVDRERDEHFAPRVFQPLCKGADDLEAAFNQDRMKMICPGSSLKGCRKLQLPDCFAITLPELL